MKGYQHSFIRGNILFRELPQTITELAYAWGNKNFATSVVPMPPARSGIYKMASICLQEKVLVRLRHRGVPGEIVNVLQTRLEPQLGPE